jgi:hypothetical protein
MERPGTVTPTVLAPGVPTLGADDRRTCRQCLNLSSWGKCLAAARGELPLVSLRYEPIADRLERCVRYSPTANDADRRPGRERDSGLSRRLLAFLKAKRRGGCPLGQRALARVFRRLAGRIGSRAGTLWVEEPPISTHAVGWKWGAAKRPGGNGGASI